MSARTHMVDFAPKARRRRPIDWRRVYDNVVLAYIGFCLAAWLTRGLIW